MDELEKSVEELLRLRETWIPENTRLSLELLAADPVSAFSSRYDFTSLIREVVKSSEVKPEKMSERVNHVLELATRVSNIPNLSAQQKARILLLKGKTLNATAALTQGSCDIKSTLERALKLDPKLADAWCEIGEFEWMTIGPEAAISSFTNALKIDSQNSDVLWRLSMVLRQLPRDSPSLHEFLSNSSDFPDFIPQSNNDDAAVISSLRLAYAAVRAANASSGRAWECLGNAIFTASLSDSAGSGGMVTRSLAAFAQAAKHADVIAQPHFHFNRAEAFHYIDNFTDALGSWFRAALLDPAWPAPRIAAMRCLSALYKMHNVIHTSLKSADKVTRKRVNSLLGTLTLPSSRIRHLGPYHDLRYCDFDELNVGSNRGVVCCGAVVASLPGDNELTLNLQIVDAKAAFLVLRIFQISKGSGPSTKDVIAIPNPIIEECSIPSDLVRLLHNFDACARAEGAESTDDDEVAPETDGASCEEDINFRILRVPSPQILCVNGSRVGRAWTAAAVPKNVFFASA
ncbi:hypothetical protein Aperf_G00000045395 [Anoplocephala perfoliata]